MLNQVVLVGRIKETKESNIRDENNSKCKLIIDVQKSYKNSKGEYESDLIPCELYNVVAQSTIEYCKIGDIVGVKGTLENKNDKLCVRVDKITFLSSKKEKE